MHVKVRKTERFRKWIDSLKDIGAKVRILRHFDRIEEEGALFGDIKSLGDRVYEMRFHFGAGYRVYFAQRGNELVILLSGGDKSRQKQDIRDAKEMAGELEW